MFSEYLVIGVKMNFTKLSPQKIKWLTNSSEFKKSPIKILTRVLVWEIFRKFGKRMSFTFDRNLKIFLFPDDGVASLTYYFGYHEPEIFNFLAKILDKLQESKKEIVYCDIGANIGLYSLFAAKRLKNKGKVIAFEPQPLTYKRFIENIKLNSLQNIIVINKALGDNNGAVSLVQSLDSAKTFVSKALNNSEETKIDLISFDTFLRENKISNIDYLKIDVEGFEFFVLQGMKEFLRSAPPKIIQIELYDEFLIRSGSSLNQTISFLKDLDFTFWKLNEHTLKLYECTNNFSGDLFLIRKDYLTLNKDFLNL